MWTHERRRHGRRNWVAIISYSASLALSAAIWTGVF